MASLSEQIFHTIICFYIAKTSGELPWESLVSVFKRDVLPILDHVNKVNAFELLKQMLDQLVGGGHQLRQYILETMNSIADNSY